MTRISETRGDDPTSRPADDGLAKPRLAHDPAASAVPPVTTAPTEHVDRRRGGAGARVGAAAGANPPAAQARTTNLRDLELLAEWLDSRFRIPGTRIRFGLDSVLGLVPGVGDAVTTIPAAYMLFRAHQMGVPRSTLGRMGWNVALDLMVGAIPLVGDLFDLGFKANRRNYELLRQHLGQPPRTASTEPVQGSF